MSASELHYNISIQKLENGIWKPLYSEGDLHNPIYPASISKIFVGAEVLRQVESGVYVLTGVERLLYMMLNKSDDVATNELIDLVTRESINEHTVRKLGMHGSEVTRKYCAREKEDELYKNAPITMVTPRHVEEFFQKLYVNDIHSPFVSEKLKEYMSKVTGTEQLHFLDRQTACVYKGGYHLSKIKDGRNCMWRHYAMIVDMCGNIYSVIVFTISKSYENMDKEIEENIQKLFNTYIAPCAP